MMENELKPCPFCGGHADIIYRVDIGFQYRPDVVIGCASPQCGVMPKTSELPHGQAIAAWNARAGAPAIDAGEVERLVDKLASESRLQGRIDGAAGFAHNKELCVKDVAAARAALLEYVSKGVEK